jgi:hypothetical protein
VSAPDPCAEAERLTAIHGQQTEKLRDARRRLSATALELEKGLPFRNQRQLGEAKASAQRRYRDALAQARDNQAVHLAATVWLNELDRLNRAAKTARRKAEQLVSEQNRLEATVQHLELAVSASRIASEAAQERCNDARGARVATYEAEHSRLAGTSTAARSAVAKECPINSLLVGDRQVLKQVAHRLSEETGLDTARLELLLVELCEQIALSALESVALTFPPGHPFWSHFQPAEARTIAVTLGRLGHHFDGRGGWLEGRAPHSRDMALALAHAGHDARALRSFDQQALENIWQGVRLEPASHLLQRAPDLSLESTQALVGRRGAALDELWDNWAQVRHALLG